MNDAKYETYRAVMDEQTSKLITQVGMRLRDQLYSLTPAQRSAIRAHFDENGKRIGIVPAVPMVLHDLRAVIHDLTIDQEY